MQASRDWPVAALACLAVLFILPLWCVASPAMPDYPAHLAGFHLISGGAKTQPLAQKASGTIQKPTPEAWLLLLTAQR